MAVGFDLQEFPTFKKASGAEGVLREGDVFTIEPGLYEPAPGDGQTGWGVRIEDLVHLGPDGLESLTPLPYEFDPGCGDKGSLPDDSAAYEKLGAFYLGRPYDAANGKAPVPLLYDSRDLLTHAVCVGMTGSGKTGLLIGLLEEAAIDGIPALVIDPKGDLANLMLTFPELRPRDFAPWIDPEPPPERA